MPEIVNLCDSSDGEDEESLKAVRKTSEVISLLDDEDEDEPIQVTVPPSNTSFETPGKRKSVFSSAYDTDSEDDDWLGPPSGLSKKPKAAPKITPNADTAQYSSKQPHHTPVFNPYGGPSSEEKRRERQLAEQQVAPTVYSFPKLSSNPTVYPDLRANYAWSFWKHGRRMINKSYERARVDAFAKRVVDLAISDGPDRSLEEFIGFGKTTSVKESEQKFQARATVRSRTLRDKRL